jgi:radical SAM superfamily enzyme YgiQ (UPF0313 family)
VNRPSQVVSHMRKRIALIYGKDEFYDNPLAIEYLKAYCLQDPELAASVEIATLTFESTDEPSEVARQILDWSPCVVGASCYVWNTDKTLQVCGLLKDADSRILTVLGGPEVGHIPEEVLESSPCTDVAISGEGEEPFRHLLRKCAAGMSVSSILGTAVRKGHEIVSAKQRPPLDLACLPAIFHDGNREYLSSLHGKVLYETLRGCPHVCFFCDCGLTSRGQVRFFPIGRIRTELDFILTHQAARHLYLADSEINIDDQHAKHVLRIIRDLKKKHRWDGSVSFHLEISKEIDSELCDLICEVTSGIGIGVQSFNRDALLQMGRRWFDRGRFEENVERLEKHIRFVFQFIYGCPGDTYETFREGLKWAVDQGRDVWFDRLRVLPGTVYRHKPERFGLQFEPGRPNYALSTNTFSAEDFAEAESLKRGFLLYTFRDLVRLDALRAFMGLDTMQLVECFGQWCSENVPDLSLRFARADPPNLPKDFIKYLVSWIGTYVLSTRSVSWAEFSKLRDTVRRQFSYMAEPKSGTRSLASVSRS